MNTRNIRGSKMRKILLLKILVLVSSFFAISSVQAGNAWYWGNITRINTNGADGSFEIYLDNPTLQATCQDQLVFFKVSDMGLERTKHALSLALSAYMVGKEWGVVINLPTSGSQCYASSTASQGAGIR